MAAILSFFLPGLGHMYNGRIFQGLLFMVLVPIVYLISIPIACIPGFLAHLFVIMDSARDSGRKADAKMHRQAEILASKLRGK